MLGAMKIEKLSNTLQKIISAGGLAGRLGIYRVMGQWEPAVGAVIASHAQPLSLRGKKLLVQVDSPVWMQQLSMLKPELIEKVNGRMGEIMIKDITLKLGEVGPRKKPASPAAPPVPLTREEQYLVETYVKDVAEPEIRTALMRLIEKDLMNKKRTGKRTDDRGQKTD
jgi:hypothetical protein